MVQYVELTRLHAHPGNPRLAAREDVIEQIVAQLNGRLDEAHALLVRPTDGNGYEIISGHHRKAAAERAGNPSNHRVAAWLAGNRRQPRAS